MTTKFESLQESMKLITVPSHIQVPREGGRFGGILPAVLATAAGYVGYIYYKQKQSQGPKVSLGKEGSSVTLSDAPPLPDWIQETFPYRRYQASIQEPGSDMVTEITFVDDGPRDGHPVILMHGNPMWGYLYRKVIKALLEDGRYRVIVPDMMGCGGSSKPDNVNAHSLDNHVNLITRVVQHLGVQDCTIVGQDWGGPIIAGVASRLPKSVVTSCVWGNTSILVPRVTRPRLFHRFSHLPVISDFAFRVAGFPLGTLHHVQGDKSSISSEDLQVYAYPFRNGWADNAAPLALARMVPNSPTHPTLSTLKPIDDWARAFTGPVALVWGMKDPILKTAVYKMREAFSNIVIDEETQAGHFLQEEVAPELVRAIAVVSGLA